MSEDLLALERQVEAELRDLGPRLSLDWPAEVASATRAVIKLELTSAWWEAVPDAAAFGRVRDVVRRELRLGRAPAAASRWWRVGMGAGVAAAAAIALIVVSGMPRHHAEVAQPLAKIIPDAGSIDRFAASAETVWAAHGLAMQVDLDSSSDTLSVWSGGGGRLEQMIDEMHQQLDDLFIEPAGDDQLSTALLEIAPV